MTDYTNRCLFGDCLEVMKDIPNKSIDMILTDLPYGTTRLSWDSVIDLDKLWLEFNRVIKEDSATVLFGNQPFSSNLIMKNPLYYKYTWYWLKPFPTGFLNANYRPMLSVEEIMVFSKSGAGAGSKTNHMKYFPQGLISLNLKKRNHHNSRGKHIHETINCGMNNILNSNKEYKQKSTNYPKNILQFERDQPQLHPTQKPVKLVEYLIKTYTNENDLVLDCCAGSGTTAIACLNTNRKYICIEKEQKYFDIMIDRINKQPRTLEVFN